MTEKIPFLLWIFAVLENVASHQGDELIAAIRIHKKQQVIRLLDRVEDVDEVLQGGKTYLNEALECKRKSIAKFLILKGAKVNGVPGVEKPLHVCARKCYKSGLKLLLRMDANVATVDRDLCTALHIAAKGWKRNVVDWLLRYGAPVDVRNNHNETPLHNAIMSGSEDLVSRIINAGADVNAPGWKRNTPLHRSVEDATWGVTHLLLLHGADPNVQNDDGLTPLHIAARNRCEKKVCDLLEAGADVNCRDHQGNTPLHFIAHHNAKPLVEFMLLKGAELNVFNCRGDTPIAIALTCGYPAVITTLVEVGAHVPTTYCAKEILSYFWPDVYRTAKNDALSDFDSYVTKSMGTFIAMAHYAKGEKKLKKLIHAYDQNGVFTVYVFLKKYFKSNARKTRIIRASTLETRKYYIMDETTNCIAKGTYLELLPSELIEDVLNVATNFVRKIEKLSWNLTLAAHALNADVDSVKYVMKRGFLKLKGHKKNKGENVRKMFCLEPTNFTDMCLKSK